MGEKEQGDHRARSQKFSRHLQPQGWPDFLGPRGSLPDQMQNLPATLPYHSLLDKDEDAYWAELRKQFLIPDDEIYLNNGTVGSSPAPVLRAIFDGYTTTEKLDQHEPEDYPIWGYAAWNEFRDPLAAFVGCHRDEIALLRNATEANSYIANGVDMKPGDEVLMTDQEHPGGEHPWNLKAKRYGIVVKKITLPRPVKNAAEVLNLFNDAITPRTRVIFFSHITHFFRSSFAGKRTRGAGAYQRNSFRRGRRAHSRHDAPECPRTGLRHVLFQPAQMAASHQGSGFLYVRDEVIDRLWNTIATEGWDDKKIRAERFQRIGSSNVPALWGLRAAIKLANEIGIERIESRHRALADYLLAEMLKRGAVSWTSADPALRCAIVTVNVPPVQRLDLENWLWHTYKIRIRGADPNKLRLSTPYYIQKKDINRFLEKFDEYKRDKKMA